jgi:hypothetical protein
MRLTLIAISLLFLTSCGAKKGPTILSSGTNPTTTALEYEPYADIDTYSEDEEYGLTGDKPVKVGEQSVSNQRRYLASLAGPNGELITFHRRGSCCGYKSDNGFGGVALVDVYEVLYDGIKEPILVYISFYDYETIHIPKGFTKRNL